MSPAVIKNQLDIISTSNQADIDKVSLENQLKAISVSPDVRLQSVVWVVSQLAQTVPSLLEEETREFLGLTRGLLVPFILWYSPQALQR